LNTGGHADVGFQKVKRLGTISIISRARIKANRERMSLGEMATVGAARARGDEKKAGPMCLNGFGRPK